MKTARCCHYSLLLTIRAPHCLQSCEQIKIDIRKINIRDASSSVASLDEVQKMHQKNRYQRKIAKALANSKCYTIHRHVEVNATFCRYTYVHV